MEITTKTQYRKIQAIPQLKPFGKYLLPCRGISGWAMKFMTPESLKMWDANLIADGFRYLAGTAEKNRVFYPVYDEEAARKDPALREQAIFFFPAARGSRCVFLCAGGGYSMACNLIETFPVARKVNERGYHAVAVNYRTGKNALCPNPIEDLARAVLYVTAHARELGADMSGYYVMGFSAGGHLVSNYAIEENGYGAFGAQKPSGIVLSYPVTDLGEYGHGTTREQFLGKGHLRDRTLIDRYSSHRHLTKDYPPTFLWLFDRDDTVDPMNSQLFAESAEKAGMPCCFESYPGTLHGASLGTGTACEGWFDRAFDFLESER